MPRKPKAPAVPDEEPDEGPTDCRVMSNWEGLIAFVFDRELTEEEAQRFERFVGVWPIHTVHGKLEATKPMHLRKKKKNEDNEEDA